MTTDPNAPAVIINDLAAILDGVGYSVDILNYEGLNLHDTQSAYFATAERAEEFARNVAGMLFLPLIRSADLERPPYTPAVVGSVIGCPLSAGCGLFDTSADLTAHLSDVHGTTYDLATGSTLSQDECDALGLTWGDGTGEYTLANITAAQRVALYAYRNRDDIPDDGYITPLSARGPDDPRDAEG